MSKQSKKLRKLRKELIFFKYAFRRCKEELDILRKERKEVISNEPKK